MDSINNIFMYTGVRCFKKNSQYRNKRRQEGLECGGYVECSKINET